jgi:hypothetical protein
MKPIRIFFSKLGRKNEYLGVYGEKSAYPVIYFRKSKYATQQEFDEMIDMIKGLFPKEEI